MNSGGSVAANSTTSGLTTDTNRGSTTTSGRGRSGGRGRNGRGGRHGSRGNTSGRPRSTSFKGTTAEMNGNVFECYDEQTDRRQYAKTVEALEGHVKKNLKYAEDLSTLFAINPKLPTLKKPAPPGKDADESDTELWKEEIKELAKRKRVLRGNLMAIYAVIWGQCSEAMKAKVKSLDGYAKSTEDDDCIWLLNNIKAVTMQFDANHNGYMSMLNAIAGLVNCRQQPEQSVDHYLEVLRSHADTIKYHGGTLALNPNLAPEFKDDGTKYTTEERATIAHDCTLAAALIRGSDPTRYGTLVADLANQHSKGKDEYPTDVLSAFGLLVNYQTPTNATRNQRNNSTSTSNTTTTTSPEGSGMIFAQRGTSVAGTNGVLHEGITCYRCNGTGHYACDCPNESGGSATGATLLQNGLILAQRRPIGIDPKWILLDSQSTISVFNNPDMLRNIRPSEEVIRVITNGGYQDSRLVGDFPNLGKVWFNPNSIANILSLAHVRKVCNVSMDTNSAPEIVIHRLDGSEMRFAEHECGLYVYDPAFNDTNTPVTAYTMLTTVADNKKLYTPRDVTKADEARRLYRLLGRPSESSFMRLLTHNFLLNCPVTPLDAKRALAIYGPDVATLKGKTTRASPSPRVDASITVPLPAHIIDNYSHIVLCIDFFYVQGHVFFHTISRDLQFRTVRHVPDRGYKTLKKIVLDVIQLYHTRGFRVVDVHGDSEFECLRPALHNITLNVVPADSHVGEVERSIRTIKERIRACAHGLPFRRLPTLMITHIVSDAVRCLNMFPAVEGVSQTLSPNSLVTGARAPDYNNFRLEFGSYVQLFDDSSPTNTIRSRTHGAIALTPTGNSQGDYFFLSLSSGARVSRHRWIALPIPDTAIARVEALALHEKQPLLQERGLVVEWRPDHPIDPDEYDRDFVPPTDPPRDFDLPLADFAPLDVFELDDLHADVPVPPDDLPPASPIAAQGARDPHQHPHVDLFHEENAVDEDNDEDYAQDDNIDDEYDDHDGAIVENHEEDTTGHDDLPQDDLTEHDDLPQDDQGADQEPSYQEQPPDEDDAAIGGDQGADTAGYNLRPRDNANNERFRTAMDKPYSSKSYFPPAQLLHKDIFAYIMTQMATNTEFAVSMTQMSANAGLKKHGRKAEEALLAEFAQLEDLGVYEPLNPGETDARTKETSTTSDKLDQGEAVRAPKGPHRSRRQITTEPLRQVRDCLANRRYGFAHGIHYHRRPRDERQCDCGHSGCIP
jgi:hypothetical protein